jgi:hypothetical protein
MGFFNKFFKPTAPKMPEPPKPRSIKPPSIKPPVINPANGMVMHGGIGGFDGKGNLYGHDKKPNFPKANPFPNRKF